VRVRVRECDFIHRRAVDRFAMEQWNRIQNADDIIIRLFCVFVVVFVVVLLRRQEKAGNVRVRVFEHVGEDFRAGRRVEFDGFFGGGGAHDVMYDVIYISSPFLCTTKRTLK
jgi:hypothetical protein